MLVVERRANDIYFHDSLHEEAFQATIQSSDEGPYTFFNIEITIKSHSAHETDKPYKVFNYKAPNLLEAGRLILGEYILYEALFEGEETNYMIAEYWLDHLDGGTRHSLSFGDDDDDDYDDYDDYFYDDDDGGNGGGLENDIIIFSAN